MTIKVAFMQLSDCWGCHQSLLNAHLGLLDYLPALEIVYWPAVVDFKLNSLKSRDDKEILLGFVEGCIRTNADYENAKLMRKKCISIIAFGTCACHGNVFGLANQWSKHNLINRKFKEVESITDVEPEEPTENLPGFRDRVINLDEFIQVDFYLPGCPPRTEQILAGFEVLLDYKRFPKNEQPFCYDCGIRYTDCILNKEILCFGSITSNGCSLKCPEKGIPCVGCRGPSTTASDEAIKLNKMTSNLSQLDQNNRKNIFEFLTLFLHVPLMAGFDWVKDILRQIKLKGRPEMIVGTYIPITEEIGSNLLRFLRYYTDFYKASNVCDTCLRIRGRLQMTDVKRDYEDLPNVDDCFIEQGYICLGPVTKAGCGGLCLRVNAPCTGCYGQTEWVKDQPSRFAETVINNFNVRLTKEELLRQVLDPIGVFEKFTLSSRRDYKGGE